MSDWETAYQEFIEKTQGVHLDSKEARIIFKYAWFASLNETYKREVSIRSQQVDSAQKDVFKPTVKH